MDSDKSWETEFKTLRSYDVNKKLSTDVSSQSQDEQEKKLIHDFSSYTTLHGFHFTLNSRWPWRRVVWMLLIAIGFGFLVAQIYTSLEKLYAREVDARKSVEDAKSLPFPAVTICNQNMMRKSQIFGTIAQDYLDQMDGVKLTLGGLKQKEVPSFDVQKTLEKAGHQLTQMILVCEFAGKECSVVKSFTPATSSFMYGLCYTFNANGSAGNVGAGKRQGLKIHLDAQPEEYYGPFSYESTGFKVAIHKPGTFHDIENEGYDISPGFYTTIRIKQNKIISLPSPYPSGCGSKKLENFAKYSISGCYQTCVSKLIANKCNCRILSMVEKGINISRFCNSSEIIKCFFEEIMGKTMKEISPSTCGCPRECEAVNYNVKTSIAYYPSEHLWDSLLPFIARLSGVNVSDISDPQQKVNIQTTARKRTAITTVFYENLLTDVTKEKPTYGISQLGSDIGGNMGLFLGCSLLTICEFIDLIIMVCLHRRRKRTAATGVTINNDR